MHNGAGVIVLAEARAPEFLTAGAQHIGGGSGTLKKNSGAGLCGSNFKSACIGVCDCAPNGETTSNYVSLPSFARLKQPTKGSFLIYLHREYQTNG